MNKLNVSFDEHTEWVKSLADKYSGQSINIVAPYRGGVVSSIHLNHLLEDSTLSLVGYQTRDSNDKSPTLMNNNILDGKLIVIVDDIYDTGKTIIGITKYLDLMYNKPEMNIETMFDKGQGFGWNTVGEDIWVTFPWEV